MPVTVLFCEGVRGGADARVLDKLLVPNCRVEPVGSKHAMDMLILARREVSPLVTVMGLKDGDFDRDWQAPSDQPRPWTKRVGAGRTERIGWIWARKEIENYLIDPEVVARALGPGAPPPDRYRDALDRAAAEISDYTAARIALSQFRPTVRPLTNQWGRRRGRDRYHFPDDLSRMGCRKSIRGLVRRQAQGTLPEPKRVLAAFYSLIPLHQTAGLRRAHYLHTYAGKDLLIQMDSDLRRLGFGDFTDFRERILAGIRFTTDDIANWLPEWAALRAEIQNYTP
jgi:hypothetical protein